MSLFSKELVLALELLVSGSKTICPMVAGVRLWSCLEVRVGLGLPQFICLCASRSLIVVALRIILELCGLEFV